MIIIPHQYHEYAERPPRVMGATQCFLLHLNVMYCTVEATLGVFVTVARRADRTYADVRPMPV
jgi:hypothetical protein